MMVRNVTDSPCSNPAFAQACNRFCPSRISPSLFRQIVAPLIPNFRFAMSIAMPAMRRSRSFRLTGLQCNSQVAASRGVIVRKYTIGSPGSSRLRMLRVRGLYFGGVGGLEGARDGEEVGL